LGNDFNLSQLLPHIDGETAETARHCRRRRYPSAEGAGATTAAGRHLHNYALAFQPGFVRVI
jgi:hypothetical protein